VSGPGRAATKRELMMSQQARPRRYSASQRGLRCGFDIGAPRLATPMVSQTPTDGEPTGQQASDELYPGGIGFFGGDPAAAAIFNAEMTAKADHQIAGVLSAYDFPVFGVIGDIGGCDGEPWSGCSGRSGSWWRVRTRCL
jgi:hypothetical protein